MPARKPIPDDHHVARFVPKNKQKRHPDTDEFQGLSGAAFALRADDKGGLSVTWVEFFGGLDAATVKNAAIAYRESLPSKNIAASAAFAIASGNAIKSSALRYKKRVRIVHDPVIGNDGHAEIRHFTDEDHELLDVLASDVFLDIHMVAGMNLPKVGH